MLEKTTKNRVPGLTPAGLDAGWTAAMSWAPLPGAAVSWKISGTRGSSCLSTELITPASVQSNGDSHSEQCWLG